MSTPFLLRSAEEPAVQKGAILSECGRFRYFLSRSWAPPWTMPRSVNFVMLNPSTADAESDDATIRKCMSYARKWGADEIVVTNLYPFRSTSPMDMKRAPDRLGPPNRPGSFDLVNHVHLFAWACWADLVVCAWGNHAEEGAERVALAKIRAAGKTPHRLVLTKEGKPAHPLYLPGDLEPTPWDARRDS